MERTVQITYNSSMTPKDNSEDTRNGSSFIENKYSKMKKVVNSIEEYLETRSDDTAILINKNLQALSFSIDLSIFDPHTNIAAQFFVSLYDLMNKLEPRSQMTWHCIDVLSNACKNPSARQTLIDTYHFIPSLSRLIGDQLTTEKKTRLLRLMQDLTCGIKIPWQIPHLPYLMVTLTRWVESQDEEIVTLSLGVLVNLCYKNIPAIYTLSRNVDIKKFLRTCMPLKGPVIEVYVCKLMIILDDINGEVPTNILVNLIEPTFKAITEAYKAKDAILLRQVSEFFLDRMKTKNHGNPLGVYGQYNDLVSTLLEVIDSEPNEDQDSSQDPDCTAIVLEFVHHLVQSKVPTINSLYPTMLRIALKWIQTAAVSFHALALLRTVAINVDEKENSILESLAVGLPVFMLILNHKEDQIQTDIESNKRLGALLQLLRAMIQVPNIRKQVIQELNEDMFSKIFVPLLGDESPRLRASNSDTCSTEAVNLYVYALALIVEMVKYNKNWITLMNCLVENRHIHIVVAQALYNSSEEVKNLALEISANTSFPKKKLAVAISSLQSMYSLGQKSPSKLGSPMVSHELNFPLLSVAQIQRLDNTIDKLRNLISERNVVDISTSDVMELYEYKLASMGQAERAAMASVEAASERCTHLQHRVAQLTAEQNRIHQLLFHTEQRHEDALRKKESMMEEFRSIQNKLEAEKGRYKACDSQLKIKDKALNESNALLEETQKKLVEVTDTKNNLEDQCNKLQQIVSKLQDNCLRLEKNLQKKDESLKKVTLANENLKSQIHDLEKSLSQKVERLEEVQGQLQIKSAILENITKMANSQL